MRGVLNALFQLILTEISLAEFYDHPHLLNEETEAYRTFLMGSKDKKPVSGRIRICRDN